MGISSRIHNLQVGVPLRVLLLCGLVGILVDLDHIIAYYKGWEGRCLHTPLLIISSLVLGGCSTYRGGLYLRHLLRKDK